MYRVKLIILPHFLPHRYNRLCSDWTGSGHSSPRSGPGCLPCGRVGLTCVQEETENLPTKRCGFQMLIRYSVRPAGLEGTD